MGEHQHSQEVHRFPVIVDDTQQQIHKRLTLNLLIQGAAMHTHITAHHLVRNELEALRPGLTRLYDQVGVSLALNYYMGDYILLFGMPSRFWTRVTERGHPFYGHRLLSKHGFELWRASKGYLLERAAKKGVSRLPVMQALEMYWQVFRTAMAEMGRRGELARLAKLANAQIWGISEERLHAELTMKVGFGHLRIPKTPRGRLVQIGVIGYGGVVRRHGEFQVVAKSWVFPLVLHELTKGTAELVCLHGLNALDDTTYAAVTDYADQIEFEGWMLQVGPEMWRRFLAALPDQRRMPDILMHCARLDPPALEDLMMAVVEDPGRARSLLAELG